jgi:hypothetical protein
LPGPARVRHRLPVQEQAALVVQRGLRNCCSQPDGVAWEITVFRLGAVVVVALQKNPVPQGLTRVALPDSFCRVPVSAWDFSVACEFCQYALPTGLQPGVPLARSIQYRSQHARLHQRRPALHHP